MTGWVIGVAMLALGQGDWELRQASVIESEPEGVYRVESSLEVGAVVPAMVLRGPGIETSWFALRGELWREIGQPADQLEMWVVMPDGSRYFSRIQVGGMREQQWHDFVVPFQLEGSEEKPAALALNAVMVGAGSWKLRDLDVVSFSSREALMDAMPSAQTLGMRMGMGMWGGIMGALLGVLGAIVGVFTSRGRGKALVLALLMLMMVVGLCSLVMGVVFLMGGKGYAVYYPLLILGVIALLLPLSLFRTVRLRFRELEMRRMRSRNLS